MTSLRPLLVDPSARGGIALYTQLVADGLRAAGAEPTVLGSRGLERTESGYRVRRWLPEQRWGRPEGAGLRFYAARGSAWAASALAVEAAARIDRPDVIHFQAALNRRFDARLLRRLGRRAPVVWTAHDVLPPDRTEQDAERYAAIYRAASLVLVHGEPAAEEVRRLAGVEPVVIEHPVPSFTRTERAAARRELGLPEEGRILAAVGFIRSYKGYGLLADVWEALGAEAPTLLVVGELLDEFERPVVERLARTGRVLLRLGYASEAELQLAVCAADALVLPYVSASESGIVHVARAAGVPVLVSDVPQLARSVEATGAGRVLAREVEVWRDAVTGRLPPAPPPPPGLESVGREHLAAYERALDRKGRRRLSVLAYTDAVEVGGAEHSLATLLGALGGHLDVRVMGVTAEVVDAIAASRPGTPTTVVPPVANKADLRPILAHLRAVRALRPDVFHANLRIPWSCQYGLAAALATPGVRTIAVEHLPLPSSGWFQRLLKRRTSARLAAHVAVGERAAREVEELAGLERGSVRTIYNGVPDVAVEPLPRTQDGPVVGTIGRLVEQKGFDVLVRSLATLPGVSGVIVGDGPERESLESLAERVGVADRLTVTGWTVEPRRRLPSFDVFVLPSRFEAFPLSILEAMLAGLPVVATDVGSVHEAVADGETGLLVPPEDEEALAAALGRLVEDVELRRRLGEQGRAVALERFTPEAMAAAFEALYEEICR